MTRPDYCPMSGEPCQSMCDVKCSSTRKREPARDHDPKHPYVQRLVGCGHGRLFTEPCVDCEVVDLMDRYRNAIRTVQRVRDRMRELGRPMPGQTSLPRGKA